MLTPSVSVFEDRVFKAVIKFKQSHTCGALIQTELVFFQGKEEMPEMYFCPHECTEERSCENTARRQESPCEKPNQPAP